MCVCVCVCVCVCACVLGGGGDRERERERERERGTVGARRQTAKVNRSFWKSDGGNSSLSSFTHVNTLYTCRTHY